MVRACPELCRRALWPAPEEWERSLAGLSNLATTVILVGVAVALTVAVALILGPRIIELANRTGGQIESVPMDWAP
jgi:uncharacterized membrane protein YdfJ with MMPL/SSD domain